MVYHTGLLGKRNMKFCLYPRTRTSDKEASFDVILYGMAPQVTKDDDRDPDDDFYGLRAQLGYEDSFDGSGRCINTEDHWIPEHDNGFDF